nr:FAD-binding oxidoreductase [Saprospiraceae bacterium]
LFWAGGSYQWHYPDLEPSAGEREYILQHLGEMLEAPFDIVGHAAGVRPSVKDRRPFLGESQVHANVFIFNGLGTKGALLAPYWAEHLAAHLLEGKALEAEVRVER